jgi:hypothetical protein
MWANETFVPRIFSRRPLGVKAPQGDHKANRHRLFIPFSSYTHLLILIDALTVHRLSDVDSGGPNPLVQQMRSFVILPGFPANFTKVLQYTTMPNSPSHGTCRPFQPKSSTMARPIKTIGYIGLGNAGFSMSSNLPKNGYHMIVHDLDADKV